MGRTTVQIAYKKPPLKSKRNWRKLFFNNMKTKDHFITRSCGEFTLPKKQAKTVLGGNASRMPRTFNVWMSAN